MYGTQNTRYFDFFFYTLTLTYVAKDDSFPIQNYLLNLDTWYVVSEYLIMHQKYESFGKFLKLVY